MSPTKSQITGHLNTATQIRFALSNWDSEGPEIMLDQSETFELVDGTIPETCRIWQNLAGLRGTSYTVYSGLRGADGYCVETELGSIQVPEGESHALATLLEASGSITPGNSYTIIADAAFATLSTGLVSTSVARRLGSSTAMPAVIAVDAQSNGGGRDRGQDTDINQTGGGIWIWDDILEQMVIAEYGVYPLNSGIGGTTTNPANCYAKLIVHMANEVRALGLVPAARPIWLANNAQGGQPISAWVDSPYTMMTALDDMIAGMSAEYGSQVYLDHLHWQQGEANSETDPITAYNTDDGYYGALETWYAMRSAKPYWTSETTVTIGELLSSRAFLPTDGTRYIWPTNERNRALRRFAASALYPKVGLVPSSDLPSASVQTIANRNHYSGGALQTIGERAAHVLVGLRAGTASGAHQLPSGAAYTVHPQISVGTETLALGTGDLLTGQLFIVSSGATEIWLPDHIENGGNCSIKLICGAAGTTLNLPSTSDTLKTHAGLVSSATLDIGVYDIFWANRWNVEAKLPTRGDHLKFVAPPMLSSTSHGLTYGEGRSASIVIRGGCTFGLPLPEEGATVTVEMDSNSAGTAYIGRACHSASIINGGTGYAAGDTITPALGGASGTAPTITVAAVNGSGTITSVRVTEPACITSTAVPTNPVAQVSTSGSGTGAQFNLTYSADLIFGPLTSGSTAAYPVTLVRQVVQLQVLDGVWFVVSDNAVTVMETSGTWTPTFSNGTPGTLSVAYTSQTGTWVRHGNMIYIEGEVVFTPTIGTASGYWYIGGLPLPAVGLQSMIAVRASANVTLPASRYEIIGNATTASRLRLRTSVTDADLPVANVGNGVATTIRFAGWYSV